MDRAQTKLLTSLAASYGIRHMTRREVTAARTRTRSAYAGRYKFRPIASQPARRFHYAGAVWRVSTYRSPSITVDAIQGLDGYTGCAGWSWYRSGSFTL